MRVFLAALVLHTAVCFVPTTRSRLKNRGVPQAAVGDDSQHGITATASAPARHQRRSILAGLPLVFWVATPARAEPAAMAEGSLLNSLYLIRRVQEATVQEERLLKSGKYKDLQRSNVKLAATMMLRNYQLEDCIITASRAAGLGKVQQASESGRNAIDALNQINEYFDSSENSLKVNTITAEKQQFVLKALNTARDNLDNFLGYMPPEVVAKATQIVQEENDLNAAEYKVTGAGYLNPADPAPATPQPVTPTSDPPPVPPGSPATPPPEA